MLRAVREAANPVERAVEMERVVRNLAQHAAVPGFQAGLFGFNVGKSDHLEVASGQVAQGFREERPGRHVGRRERVADERDAVGGRQRVERKGPDQTQNGLSDEGRFREHRRHDHRRGLEVTRNQRTGIGMRRTRRPAVVVGDGVERKRFGVPETRPPVDGPVQL